MRITPRRYRWSCGLQVRGTRAPPADRGHTVQGGDDARRARVHHAAYLRRAQRAKSDHRPFYRWDSGDANLESAIEHIAVAQRTDLLLVAPATADTLAKFARGLADDFLSTLIWLRRRPLCWRRP